MSISANPSPAEFEKANHEDSVNELIDTLLEAFNSERIASLAKSANGLVALSDRFTSPEMGKLLETLMNNLGNLTTVINLLGKLIDEGALDKITGLLAFLGALLDSLNSSMVTSVMGYIMPLVPTLDKLVSSSVMDLVPSLVQAVDEAVKEAESQTGDVKLKEVIKLARDPQVIANLKFVLLIVQKLSIGSKA